MVYLDPSQFPLKEEEEIDIEEQGHLIIEGSAVSAPVAPMEVDSFSHDHGSLLHGNLTQQSNIPSEGPIKISSVVSGSESIQDIHCIVPTVQWRSFLNYCLICGQTMTSLSQSKKELLSKLKTHYVSTHIPFFKTHGNVNHYIFCYICKLNIPYGATRAIGHFYRFHESLLIDHLKSKLIRGELMQMHCVVCNRGDQLQVLAAVVVCSSCATMIIHDGPKKWVDRSTKRPWLKRNSSGSLCAFEKLRSAGLDFSQLFPKGNLSYLPRSAQKSHTTTVHFPYEVLKEKCKNQEWPKVLVKRVDKHKQDRVFVKRFLFKQHRFIWKQLYDMGSIDTLTKRPCSFICPLCTEGDPQYFFRRDTYKYHIEQWHITEPNYHWHSDPFKFFFYGTE